MTPAERLAFSLISTGENTDTVALCRADLLDALERAESDEERRAVARDVIRMYAGQVPADVFEDDPEPDMLPLTSPATRAKGG